MHLRERGAGESRRVFESNKLTWSPLGRQAHLKKGSLKLLCSALIMVSFAELFPQWKSRTTSSYVIIIGLWFGLKFIKSKILFAIVKYKFYFKKVPFS